VGNIYASEALFLAGIRPLRSVTRLKLFEIQKLISEVKTLLTKAIRQGGSSVSDYYSFTGTKGNFQLQHNVYDRKGLACRKCNSLISAQVLSGRSTFWCPVCQK
jgi:formamidopyrimidine-DNA glycosylase